MTVSFFNKFIKPLLLNAVFGNVVNQINENINLKLLLNLKVYT